MPKFVGNQKNLSILETDINGEILYINSQYSTLSGYSKKDLIGRFNVFEEPFISSSVSQKILEKISTNRVWIGTIKNHTKDAKEYWTNTTVYIQKENLSQKIIFVSTLATQTDISNVKRVSNE